METTQSFNLGRQEGDLLAQEKMVSTLLDSVQKFEAIWELWAHHMGIPLIPGLTVP